MPLDSIGVEVVQDSEADLEKIIGLISVWSHHDSDGDGYQMEDKPQDGEGSLRQHGCPAGASPLLEETG